MPAGQEVVPGGLQDQQPPREARFSHASARNASAVKPCRGTDGGARVSVTFIVPPLDEMNNLNIPGTLSVGGAIELALVPLRLDPGKSYRACLNDSGDWLHMDMPLAALRAPLELWIREMPAQPDDPGLPPLRTAMPPRHGGDSSRSRHAPVSSAPRLPLAGRP
jgi:hypothetical protein